MPYPSWNNTPETTTIRTGIPTWGWKKVVDHFFLTVNNVQWHVTKKQRKLTTQIKLTPSEAKENLLAFCWCSFSVENFHEHQIEHDSLKRHPRKRDQEEIMKGYGYSFTYQLQWIRIEVIGKYLVSKVCNAFQAPGNKGLQGVLNAWY